MADHQDSIRRYEYVLLFGAPYLHNVLVYKLSYEDYEILKSERGLEPVGPTNVYGLLSYDVPPIEMMNALGRLGFQVTSAVNDEEHAYIMERKSGNGNCKKCSCSYQRNLVTENKSHWSYWFTNWT